MLATIGVVFYQNTLSLQEAMEAEKKTQAVVVTLENTLAATLDAEAEMRGFIATGNSTYLDLFESAKRTSGKNLSDLKTLLEGNKTQMDELGRLGAALDEFWSVAAGKIDRRRQFGPEILVEELSVRDTKAALDRIRASIETVKAIETTASMELGRDSDVALYRTIIILLIASLAGIAALGMANALVWSEGRKRAEAERKLIESNRSLERTVEERTQELRLANESLSSIAAERKMLLVKEQRAREEAEVANRLRDEFMATVSHELRTPLNSILGWARMMKGGTLDEVQMTKALRTIIKNSETQNRLIEDLLDVARIISGRLELEKVRLDVSEVVSHSVESVRPAADAKNISIGLLVEDTGGACRVEGDRARLEQVFSNLLTNAVKFTPENGTIEVSILRKSANVEIIVTDSGTGISPQFLPMVFERFRQDAVTQNNKGGLGLGLAVVRNLVELHGGSAKAVSGGAGQGASFFVYLPAMSDAATANDGQQAAAV